MSNMFCAQYSRAHTIQCARTIQGNTIYDMYYLLNNNVKRVSLALSDSIIRYELFCSQLVAPLLGPGKEYE